MRAGGWLRLYCNAACICLSVRNRYDIVMKESAFRNCIDRLTALAFGLALVIEIFCVVIDKSSVTNAYQSRMFLIAFALCAMRCLWCFLSRCYSRRELLLIAAAFVIAVISWRITGNNDLIRFLAFLCALRTVDVRRAAKLTLWLTLAGCIVLGVLAAAGVLGTLTLTTDYGNGVETRWTLGLGHPNSLHCMALMLMLLGMYLYDRYLKLYIYALLLAGNVILYFITDSDMSFFVGTAAILLSLAMHYGGRWANGRLVYGGGAALFALGLAFSVFAAVSDPRKDMQLLKWDRALLTGRITSLWETIYHEGTLATWKWFGSRFNTYYFDLGWVRVVYWYGIIPALIFIAIVFLLIWYFHKTGNRAAFVMLIAMVLYTVMEAHLVSEFIGRNYLLFLAAQYMPEMVNGTKPKDSAGNRMRAARKKSTGI